MKSPNPWHGLLFLHGHIADPALARALSTPRATSPAPGRSALGVLGHVRFLGGRPMHAGHNFDIEEPLVEEAPVEASQAASTRMSVPATRDAECTRQPVAC